MRNPTETYRESNGKSKEGHEKAMENFIENPQEIVRKTIRNPQEIQG